MPLEKKKCEPPSDVTEVLISGRNTSAEDINIPFCDSEELVKKNSYPIGRKLTLYELKNLAKSPMYNLYLDVCKEIIKIYRKGENIPESLIKVFGRSIDDYLAKDSHMNNELYPLPVYKVSKFLGFSQTAIGEKFKVAKEGLNEKLSKFRTISRAKKILSNTFNVKLANIIISKYVEYYGKAVLVFYKFSEIIFEQYGLAFDKIKLAQLLFRKPYSKTPIKSLTGHHSDLTQIEHYWQCVYAIKNLKKDSELGFLPDGYTLKRIKQECRRILKRHAINVLGIWNIEGFSIILDSLLVISETNGKRAKVKELSRQIASLNIFDKERWISRIIHSWGGNIINRDAESLYEYVCSFVFISHRTARRIENYLKNNGFDTIDFELYYKEINRPLATHIDGAYLESTLSRGQNQMATAITYGMSCGRSWLTGNQIKYDNGLVLHHIRHNKHGDTKYGGFYDSLKNLAILTKAQNSEVEGKNRKDIELRLIQVWDDLCNSKVPRHWSAENQIAYEKERTSRSYLDSWFKTLNDLEKSSE